MNPKARRSIVGVGIALALAASAASAQPPRAIPLMSAGGDVAVDPVVNRAYVTEPMSATMAVVDLDSGSLVARVPAGPQPGRIVGDAATGRLFILNAADHGTLTVMSGRSALTTSIVPVGDAPAALAADFTRDQAYVANKASDSLSVIDTTREEVAATLPTGRAPVALDVSRARGKVYVANSGDGTVTVVDQASRSVVATVTVGPSPASVAVDDRTGHAYVSDASDPSIFVLDTASDGVVAVLPAGRGSTVGLASSELGRYYLPNKADGTLTVVDMARNAVVHTFVVGVSPEQAVVDASRGTVTVVDAGAPRVTILDADTDAFLAPAAVSGAPSRAAIDPLAPNLLSMVKRDGDELAIVDATNARPGTAIATAYRSAAGDRYTHTTNVEETRLLDDGALGAAWQRTQEYWRVWTSPGPGRVALCRFHAAPFDAAAPERYVADTDLCATAKAGPAQTVAAAYFVAAPSADGACGIGTAPLYRVRTTARAPSFRYTPDAATRDAMLALGWTTEGAGADQVFACTPTLRGPGMSAAPAADADGASAAPPRHPGLPLLRNQP